ncbi:MAG: amino acid ABC transporter ATP-binding protein [Oscillospiraceae bacterium]|nr:amino acid ABC transporter ATP-binding protein [Oscillospiraceae bacterium]
MLEVQNIVKRFGTAEVLKGVSFSLEQGDSLAIIGSSGSGKTTLLRCLNFLEQANEGRIIVRGETLFDASDHILYNDQSIRRKRLHFGLVFQAFHLFPQYTALKNITLARELMAREQADFKQNKKEILEGIQQRGLNLLDQVGLADKRDFYPHQLSGGQQQRVAIARALAMNPDILCFDEPTSALDPELTDEVLRVIRGLAEKNTTMVIVTHEMHFARRVADKVLFMDEGTVVEYGTPEAVFDHPSSERTRRFLERYSEDA